MLRRRALLPRLLSPGLPAGSAPSASALLRLASASVATLYRDHSITPPNLTGLNLHYHFPRGLMGLIAKLFYHFEDLD